ncbi:hypothetical protein LCGC14_1442760 [marine sediment metagenome]|uniref:Uncharacterized protein n=1 Tax=marine sediment metagenome TaxID=412755 RepID=A0A0F9K6D3_9ZZZZ
MDDALGDRMKVLSDHIEFAREWKALEVVREEIINLYGLVEGLQDSRKEDTSRGK